MLVIYKNNLLFCFCFILFSSCSKVNVGVPVKQDVVVQSDSVSRQDVVEQEQKWQTKVSLRKPNPYIGSLKKVCTSVIVGLSSVLLIAYIFLQRRRQQSQRKASLSGEHQKTVWCEEEYAVRKIIRQNEAAAWYEIFNTEVEVRSKVMKVEQEQFASQLVDAEWQRDLLLGEEVAK